MTKFTNHGAGPRGIVLESKETIWVEPGETVETDQKVKYVHDDFKAPAKAEAEEKKAPAKADAPEKKD